MNRKLASGFLSILNAKLLVSVIGVLSLPFVVRALGADGYGDYAFLMSTFSMLMILVSSGVTEGVQKFVAEDRDVEAWREQVLGYYLRIALALALAGSVVLAAATWLGLVDGTLTPRFRRYFYLLAGLVIAAQLRAFVRRSLMGAGLERYSESLVVTGKLTWLGVSLGLAWVGFGVAGFLIGKIAASLLTAAVGGFVLSRHVRLPRVLRANTPSFPKRELLSFNGRNIVLVLLLMSLFHVDVMMLRILGNSEQTGYYKAALALAEYMWLVPMSLQTLLLHSTSNLWSNDRREQIADLATTVTRYAFLVTALLAIGVYALADRFVPFYYGQEFVVLLGPLSLLLPGALGFALARPLYGINQANGNLSPLIVATGTAAVLNAALNYLLIPVYGMSGAAAATSVGYGSMFVLQVACARYLGYDPLSGMRPGRLLATVAVSAPLIVGFETLLGDPLVALAVVPVVGFLLFGAVALATGAIDGEEVLEAAELLPDPVERGLRLIVS
jgi:O-antigen/teichoic acid export membrane protein